MNPAYMLRHTMAEYTKLYGVKGYITSLKPLNPINEPDSWERKALKKLELESGADEFFEVTSLHGNPYLRLMNPLVTKKSCLKCHQHQGYKEGDIRGGLTVSVPLSPYFMMERRAIHILILSQRLDKKPYRLS